jgi:hypothetical protein
LGAVAKHRAGDIEQPIANRAEGAVVVVTALARSGVLGAAARIVSHGNACHVVESILELGIAGEPSVTMQLFPERLLTGAASQRVRKA